MASMGFTTDSVISLMEILDDQKNAVDEGTYIKLSNAMKFLYDSSKKGVSSVEPDSDDDDSDSYDDSDYYDDYDNYTSPTISNLNQGGWLFFNNTINDTDIDIVNVIGDVDPDDDTEGETDDDTEGEIEDDNDDVGLVDSNTDSNTNSDTDSDTDSDYEQIHIPHTTIEERCLAIEYEISELQANIVNFKPKINNFIRYNALTDKLRKYGIKFKVSISTNPRNSIINNLELQIQEMGGTTDYIKKLYFKSNQKYIDDRIGNMNFKIDFLKSKLDELRDI